MATTLLVGIVGLGVGWLIGLSQSPVIAAAIAALLAAAGALVGSLGTSTPRSSTLLNPAPLAALVMGLAIGAPAGLYARTTGWFAPSSVEADLNPVVARWEKLGMRREDVVRRLFDRELPLAAGTARPATAETAQGVPGGLVAAGASDECAGFRAAAKDKVLFEMRASQRPPVRKLAEALSHVKSADVALLLLEVVCPSER